MNKRKFEINLWPYAITATVIFAVFKMNGTIDWSWFKVLLPVIVYTVLAVVAALVIIALSLYKMKRDFKKTLEEQLAAADQRSDDRIAVAEKYTAACEELNKNWSRLSPEERTALFERIRNLRELMNTSERVEAMRPAECNECKQKEL
jgi:flagellar biosynthesis/type III secretory pathway M-ring protein FliF/YscJ